MTSNDDINMPFVLMEENDGGRKKTKKRQFLPSFLTSIFAPKGNVKNISIEERLTLSPLEKLTKYGRFPVKLIIHIILLICITMQVYLFTKNRQPYLGFMGEGFATSFLPEGYESLQDNTEGFYTYYFQSINETLEHLERIVDIYEKFVLETPDTFVYLPMDAKENYNVKRPIRARAVLYATSVRDVLNISSSVTSFAREPYTIIVDHLTATQKRGTPGKLLDYIGSEEETREFFDRLKELELSFDFQSLDTSAVGPFVTVAECIQWHLEFLFDHTVRGGRLPLKLMYSFGRCENTTNSFTTWFLKFVKPYIWFASLVFILSIISLLLTVKSILHRFSLFRRMRRIKKLYSTDAHANSSVVMRALAWIPLFSRYISIADIPSFIDTWNIITLVSDVMNIITSLLHFYILKEADSTSFFMGLSILLNYIHIMRYFQYYPKYYVLVLTLGKAIPSIARFFIGTIPVFLAFAVCGTLLFGQQADYFQDLDDASVTLFSLLNGDAIHDVFDMLFGNNSFSGYLSRVYIYSFVLLFICGVLNIFILIMEDAYFSINSDEGEKDIENLLTKLEDDDIEDIMAFENKKQVAFERFEKEEGVSLEYILNQENLEGNIERLRNFVERYADNSNDERLKVASVAFAKLSEDLSQSIKKKSTQRGDSFLDRLVQHSHNVFTLQLADEHRQVVTNPNMNEVVEM